MWLGAGGQPSLTPLARSWKTGPWTPCSVSCGGGTQSRSVYCVSTDGAGGLEAAEEALCAGLPRKPPATQACNLQRCAAWSAGPWSEVRLRGPPGSVSELGLGPKLRWAVGEAWPGPDAAARGRCWAQWLGLLAIACTHTLSEGIWEPPGPGAGAVSLCGREAGALPLRALLAVLCERQRHRRAQAWCHVRGLCRLSWPVALPQGRPPPQSPVCVPTAPLSVQAWHVSAWGLVSAARSFPGNPCLSPLGELRVCLSLSTPILDPSAPRAATPALGGDRSCVPRGHPATAGACDSRGRRM